MTDTAETDPVLGGLKAITGSLEDLYRDVHQHPELSMQEHNTAAKAAERLKSAGYEVTEGVGNTGVVGVLRNGEGPTVMLRADMDALPVKEATGLPYASTATATDAEPARRPLLSSGSSTCPCARRCRSRHPDLDLSRHLRACRTAVGR